MMRAFCPFSCISIRAVLATPALAVLLCCDLTDILYRERYSVLRNAEMWLLSRLVCSSLLYLITQAQTA